MNSPSTSLVTVVTIIRIRVHVPCVAAATVRRRLVEEIWLLLEFLCGHSHIIATQKRVNLCG